jgi:prophage DNA circulation protein
MPTIRDLPAQWRQRLMPAHFDGRAFHVESGSRASGRRIVMHEFPKKEQPYAEDMGRKAVEFTVRGYCITYPNDSGEQAGLLLYRRDYQLARDALEKRLITGGPGVLQLPTLSPMRVVCQSYRLTEESPNGGYCTFDMTFSEKGVQPFRVQADSQQELLSQSNALKQQIVSVWEAQSR